MTELKISKKLEWFRGMILSVADLVPLENIKEIKTFRIPKGKKLDSYAKAIKYRGKYTIVLRPEIFVEKKELTSKRVQWKLCNRDYGPFLDDLAHELAHVVHWEHNLDHLDLTAKILGRFVKWHKKNGVAVKDYYSFRPQRG